MSADLVFVSGASSGIGRALVDACPRPARVIGLCRSPGPGYEHLACDLAGPAGWQAAAACFARESAGLAGARLVFFHAAGTLTPIGFAGEVDPDAYRRNVALNAAAPCVLGDAFLRAARAVDAESHLVMVSSGAARSVYEGWSGYCAGKAALDHWVRTVGAEQAQRGSRCRVVAVAPGIVETPMQAEIRATRERDFPSVARFVALHAEGALRSPEAVARELWALLERKLENGAVLDLRDATPE